tara:strand:- start:535 stop:750 length:216 start_codon:yes stop_codon:yes gene_type:complete
LVACLLWEQKVAGSNPAIPIWKNTNLAKGRHVFTAGYRSQFYPVVLFLATKPAQQVQIEIPPREFESLLPP